jgi:hypothetical protein
MVAKREERGTIGMTTIQAELFLKQLQETVEMPGRRRARKNRVPIFTRMPGASPTTPNARIGGKLRRKKVT